MGHNSESLRQRVETFFGSLRSIWPFTLIDKLAGSGTIDNMNNAEPTSEESSKREKMFGNTWDERKKTFYETVVPAIKELSDRGARFYQVTAEDFFAQIDGEVFDGAAIVCQLGEDRSKKVKLLAIRLGGNPALTSQDRELLGQGFETPKVGMSWKTLGQLINNGTTSDSGKLLPQNYNQPITKIIGFVDSGGAREMKVDLNEVNLMSRYINAICEKNGINKLNLEVTIVEGTSPVVDSEIAKITGQSNS